MLTLRSWIVFAILWMAFVGFLGWQGWPRVPFDIANDSQTAFALERAVAAHVRMHALLAVVPPLFLLGIGWLIRRITRGA